MLIQNQNGSDSFEHTLFKINGGECPAGKVLQQIDAYGEATCTNLTIGGTTSCAVGSVVTGIDASGNVICAPDMHVKNTNCAAGKVVTGFTADGVPICVDHNTNGNCAVGQVVQKVGNNGAVTCVADANTTYTGADFATSNQSCAAGKLVTGVSNTGTVTCAAPSVPFPNTYFRSKDFTVDALSSKTERVNCDAGDRVLTWAFARKASLDGQRLAEVVVHMQPSENPQGVTHRWANFGFTADENGTTLKVYCLDTN